MTEEKEQGRDRKGWSRKRELGRGEKDGRSDYGKKDMKV